MTVSTTRRLCFPAGIGNEESDLDLFLRNVRSFLEARNADVSMVGT
jgi:hypothetical protein